MKIGWVAVFGCLLFSGRVWGQEAISQDTSPPGMKWNQINTPHFRVLFPKDFDGPAQRVANTLEHIHGPGAATLGVSPKKISILLHSQASISNAFVTLAPRRSEFYTMPPQNYNFIGTNEWFELLATHEYRHVAQFDKSRTGFNKLIYYLFGQLPQAGMAFVAVPQWFWEGDAVVTETAFTPSGRGRIPEFDLLFRTNFLEGRNFNYHKQYLRSFKHNIPSHYVLGYHMVSYLRQKTGNPDIWGNITQRAWDIPFLPFTFSNAIKKETGMYVTDLYDEMAADLKSKWSAQQEGLAITKFEGINKRKSATYTDYSYPQPLQDGTVLVMKSGLGDIAQLVAISPDGTEQKHFVPGPLNDAGMLSAAGGKVVWNEYRFDPRWLTRSYSIVKGYDLKAGQRHVVAKHSRYAAAAISPDEDKVATVETDDKYQTRLVVLDYSTGQVLKALDNPLNELISMPRWSNDGKSIVAISRGKEGKSIVQYDYQTGGKTLLYNAGDENVGYPVIFDGYLYYNSPFSGIDNINALRLDTKAVFQVTSSKYGAYNPAVSADGKTLYYNEQTKDGLDVVKSPIVPDLWKPLGEVKVVEALFGNEMAKQEGHADLMKTIPDITYDVKRYHRAKGMFNPHTWGLNTTSSFDFIDVSVFSRDVLSTTVMDFGYRYDVADRTGQWRAGISYQGMYPILDFSVSYGDRTDNEFFIENNAVREINFDWKETSVEAGLRIPLLTTQGKYLSAFTVGQSVGYTRATEFVNDFNGGGRFLPIDSTSGILFREQLDNGDLIFTRTTFRANHLLKRSRRDIFSQWGQTLDMDFFSTPFGGSDFEGKQFSALGILFFPGLFRHHSLWAFGGYQYRQIEQSIDNYVFRNRAPSPRGHDVPRVQDYFILSGNYTFPLLYPDLPLGPLLNIQRVRGNVFFDYARAESNLFNFSQDFSSVGGELRFDVNVLRLLQQFNFGVRYSYAIELRAAEVEFIIGNIGF